MNIDIHKIATYLNEYKDNIKYSWQFDSEPFKKLLPMDSSYPDKTSDLEANIAFKEFVYTHLPDYKLDKEKFEAIAIEIVRSWGGIRSGYRENICKNIAKFLDQAEPKHISFEGIASTSKIASFYDPNKYVIYDARVAYALNWIILSQNAGKQFFPIPSSRNSSLNKFDLTTIINLHHRDIDEDNLFINKKIAYDALNQCILNINRLLWTETEKKQKPYYTEILLFSLADPHITQEIANKININIE